MKKKLLTKEQINTYSPLFYDIILYTFILFFLYIFTYVTMPSDFFIRFRIYTNGEVYKVQKYRLFSFYSRDIIQCRTLEEAKRYIRILEEEKIREKKWVIVQEPELNPH